MTVLGSGNVGIRRRHLVINLVLETHQMLIILLRQQYQKWCQLLNPTSGTLNNAMSYGTEASGEWYTGQFKTLEIQA
jgi:hypothetical protein